MAATINNTLVKIQTVTVGSGGASSIDFTSIPQTYTDLYILLSVRQVASSGGVWDNISIDFNGASTNQTMRSLITSNGTSATSQSFSRFYDWIDGNSATASTFSNVAVYIPNYSNSNYKSMSIDSVAENNGTATFLLLGSYLWSSTSAINQVTFNSNSSTFMQYSTATLYGVTATPNTTKASGGIIYQDATYMYHVFPFSGTFTPLASLSCDAIVVGGGGSGGADSGGGGGAGGFRSGTSLSLSATGYTVTVGAGGAAPYGTAALANAGSSSTFSTITSSGGGRGGSRGYNYPTGGPGGNGGSGGGGGGAEYAAGWAAGTGNSGAYSPAEGTNGGVGVGPAGNFAGGGGGGASSAGTAATGGTTTGGAGGDGNSSFSSWAIATGIGQVVSGTGYFAGGGGGGGGSAAGRGGYGGGGAGALAVASGTNGTANSGGGGGGAGNSSNTQYGGAGGSGVVIIRYAK